MGGPVSADENGLNMRPELMEEERLYHCIFKGKAFVVFKDSQEILNCYEIEDPALVSRIAGSGDGGLEGVLEQFMRENGIRDK